MQNYSIICCSFIVSVAGTKVTDEGCRRQADGSEFLLALSRPESSSPGWPLARESSTPKSFDYCDKFLDFFPIRIRLLRTWPSAEPGACQSQLSAAVMVAPLPTLSRPDPRLAVTCFDPRIFKQNTA